MGKETYLKGRTAGVAHNQGKMVRGGTPKTIKSGHECNSGSVDAELSSAAGSIYSKAVANKSGSIGDQALKDR